MAPRDARRTTLAAVVVGLLGGSEALRLSGGTRSGAVVRAAAPAMLEAAAATPLANFVLVQLDKEPAKSKGGILMPTAFSDDPNNAIDMFKAKEVKFGTVLKVGPGRVSEDGKATPAPDLEVGQRVVVGPSIGIKVETNGPTPDEAVFLFQAGEIWATA